MVEGEGQSWGALWAMLNIPSEYNIVNVIKLELVMWEQVLNSHPALQFFRLFFVRENAQFMFWNVHRDFSGINITDL